MSAGKQNGGGNVSIAVARKLKKYLELQKHQLQQQQKQLQQYQQQKRSSEGGRGAKGVRQLKHGRLNARAELVVQQLEKMHSMKQLQDKELLAAKRKLELHNMAAGSGGNSPFIVSPYACPVAETEKRSLRTRRKQQKRVLPVNRTVPAVPRGVKGSPTKAERERILDLTAKLLVATETVALPKNRNQSRESQTGAQEYFPSIPNTCRAKSSYSDPGLRSLTKEQVDKFNSASYSRSRPSKDFNSVESGSLASQPYRVENCNPGFVIRKKPASYPSSITSQQSNYVTNHSLPKDYTVLKDHKHQEDFESLDDEYFDRDFPEVNSSRRGSAWFDDSGEKVQVEISTQTIATRGTQTSRELDDECLAAIEYVQVNNNKNNRNNDNNKNTRTATTTTSTQNFGTQIHYDDEDGGVGHGSDGTVEDVVVEPRSPFRQEDVILARVDADGDRRMSMKTSSSVGTDRRRPMKTQTHFEPKVVTYQVYVLTGDLASSSTTADVRINIFGEYGDSGERTLIKSKTSNMPFQRGQIDVFDLDCKNLGKLTNIRIGHSGTTTEDGWYLSKVHIKAGPKAKNAYTFSCYKWLSAREGDGQITRDVTLSEAIPVAELPPILPRKTMMRKGSSEESEMSDTVKLKYLKSKSNRDKTKHSSDIKKSRDGRAKSGEHSGGSGSQKSSKLHRVISSTSEDSVSSDSDSDEIKKTIERYKKEKSSSKRSTSKHESPKANRSGRIAEKEQRNDRKSSAKNTHKDTSNAEVSTDTSISSCVSSPYSGKYSDDVKSKKKSKHSKRPSEGEKRHADSSEKENDHHGRRHRESPTHRRSKKSETSGGRRRKNSDTEKTSRDSPERDKVLRKHDKNKDRDKKSSKRLVSESPLHSEDVSVTESLIVPQEAELIHGTNYDILSSLVSPSPQKSEASSRDVSDVEGEGGSRSMESGEGNDEEDEEEDVDLELKDTRKKGGGGDDEGDMYMAGFRAGLTATKDKKKDQGMEENAFQQKVKNGPTIHQACESGDLDRVKELVQTVPELKDKVDERGWSPVHISSAFGHLDLLKWLTIAGVNLTQETNTGYTAIHLAAMNGHVNCIMILSAMGCSISSRTVDQFTPLHLAAQSGHLECVKWLLSNRAKVDAKDSNDRTPADLAEQFQHKECEKLLNKIGKELKRKDSVMNILRDPNALRNKSSDRGSDDEESKEESEEDDDEEEKDNDDGNQSYDDAWISDAEDVSNVVGRGGDERPPEQGRMSVQTGRRVSVIQGVLPPRPPGQPRSAPSRRMSKVEERQEEELEEKKRAYQQQQKRMQRRNSSFLDTIRQEMDGIPEPEDEFDDYD